MTWKKIIGQERVKNILQRAIIDNRIPGAYCFWGIDGIGKDALAIEFAKIVNCSDPIISTGNAEACGLCHSCRQMETLSHPNLEIVIALPAGKSSDSKSDSQYAKLDDEQLEQVKDQLLAKAMDPYHKISIPNANQIKIASVRDIKKNLSMSNNQSGRKVVIVSNAEDMTTESANAFLKTLEEPHDNVTIILTTSRKEQILPTILSRCQLIHVGPLSNEELSEALINRNGISETDARLITAFAEGSYSKALEYLSEDMKAFREESIDLFRTSLKRKAYRSELIQKIEEILKHKNKQVYENLLNLILIWLRDALYIKSTGNSNMIINIDQTESISKFVTNFADKDFYKAIQFTENGINQLRRNVQPNLVFLNLFIKLREVFY